MNRPSQTNQGLQKLETEFQQLTGPYINQPQLLHDHRSITTRRGWSPIDHLEYVFHVDLQLLIHLHTLPDKKAEHRRSPSLRGWLVLLTGWFTDTIDQQMVDYEPGNTDRDRNPTWMREHFSEWNDKLAGLHFLPPGWQDRVLEQRHNMLGRLSGSDWIRVLYLFTRFHRKMVEDVIPSDN